jgi:hypothetical protein
MLPFRPLGGEDILSMPLQHMHPVNYKLKTVFHIFGVILAIQAVLDDHSYFFLDYSTIILSLNCVNFFPIRAA